MSSQFCFLGHAMARSNRRNTISKLQGTVNKKNESYSISMCGSTILELLNILSSMLSKLEPDLNPDMTPAGSNFPDFLYLIPMITERTPEETEMKTPAPMYGKMDYFDL